MLKLLAAVAPILMLVAPPATARNAPKCHITTDLLDPQKPSKDSELAEGIRCLAKNAIKATGSQRVKMDSADAVAAHKIVILASKIIGNGKTASVTLPQPQVTPASAEEKIAPDKGKASRTGVYVIGGPAPTKQVSAEGEMTFDAHGKLVEAVSKEGGNHSLTPSHANRDSATEIFCQANALLGNRASAGSPLAIDGITCAHSGWSKDGVIKLASKIIGNG